MFFVYILQSIQVSGRFYVGTTDNVPLRLKEHNAGNVSHTAKFKPWTVKNYFAFNDREKAVAFEKYLKTGSGRAFAKRHL